MTKTPQIQITELQNQLKEKDSQITYYKDKAYLWLHEYKSLLKDMIEQDAISKKAEVEKIKQQEINHVNSLTIEG